MADEPISARASGMLVGGSSAIYEIGHWFTLDRQRDALQSHLEAVKSAIRFRDVIYVSCTPIVLSGASEKIAFFTKF